MTTTRSDAKRDPHFRPRLRWLVPARERPLTQRELLGALPRFAARWEGRWVHEAVEAMRRSRRTLALLPALAPLTVVHIWIWAALALRLGNPVPLFVAAIVLWTLLLLALMRKIGEHGA